MNPESWSHSDRLEPRSPPSQKHVTARLPGHPKPKSYSKVSCSNYGNDYSDGTCLVEPLETYIITSLHRHIQKTQTSVASKMVASVIQVYSIGGNKYDKFKAFYKL